MNLAETENWNKDLNEAPSVEKLKPDSITHQELVQKLKLANRLAEEYKLLKSNFIANISHEMRTPLNAILGFAGLSETEDVTLEELREYMKIIKKSSEQLLETIRDILYIATLDASDTNLQHDPVSARGLFQDIEEYYQYFEDKGLRPGIELSFKLPQNPDSVFVCDAEKLNLVLRKLIDNGLKFTNKGSVEVGCNGFDGNFLLFYVKDTGIGIAEDKLTLVFEPFRTIDESHSRLYGGCGLGLTIAQKLVKMMGGNIGISSKLNNGTIVTFSIKPFDRH